MPNSDDRSIRIEDKLDRVVEDIGDIKVTLAAQHESLKEHMRRTMLLEEIVKPLQERDTMARGIVQLLVLLSAVGGIAVGIVEVLNYMRHS